MSTEIISYGVPAVIGNALAFVPWRWSLGAFVVLLVLAVLSAMGAGHSEIPAPAFWLFFLVMASPLIFLGWVFGRGLCILALSGATGIRDGRRDG